MDWENLRKRLKILKVTGVTYKTVSDETGVGYGVIRNFVSGYSPTMREGSARILKEYLDEQNISLDDI